MKSFFKLVLANIVAILVLGGIFVLSLVFFLIVGAFSGGSDNYVEDDSILIFNNETVILDNPNEEKIDFFSFGKPANSVTVLDVIESIKVAKTDPKISGISLEGDFINANLTHIDDIRNALEDFKKSGKFVYAYGNSVSQSAYYLGSVANSYFLNPVGSIDLKGLSSEVVYLKDFAEKYGIGIQVLRHGKYKAAVETYMRSDMSEENREQITTMLQDIWGNIAPKIMASRKINASQLKATVDSLDGFMPETALQKKLIDKLAHKSQYDDFLKKTLKLEKDEDLPKVSLHKYIASLEDEDKLFPSSSDNGVAVLYASGAIENGKGYQGIQSETIRKEIKELAEDENIKAVVLRISSPGGSANASEEILYELQKLREKKPLVISFGDYAASGGYYIAMAGERIFSEPNTITGSIGVFGMVPYFKEIANKNGIYAHEVSTHSNSNYHSTINGVKPEVIPLFTRHIEQTYKKFVGHVMAGRKMTFEQVDNIGGGRVWTGSRAAEIGLVDQLGTLQDAIAYAAQKAKLKDYSVETFPKKKSKFDQFFSDLEGDNIMAKFLEHKVGKENYRLIEIFTQDRKKHEVMMEMPFQIKVQ